MPTSCLLHLQPFLFKGSRSTLWSHPYSPFHSLQLGSLPWSDTSPLAEILPLNPKLSVKASRRFITLSFFCSLLEQWHKRLFYNTLSMVRMDKGMQDWNRLSGKNYALKYLLGKVFALARASCRRRHFYTEIISSHTLFLVKGAIHLPSCMHEAAYCWQRSCQFHKAVGKKMCLHVYKASENMAHDLGVITSVLPALQNDCSFQDIQPWSSVKWGLGVFSLASGEECSSQLKPCDMKKKNLVFFGFLVGFWFLHFSDGSWLVFWKMMLA